MGIGLFGTLVAVIWRGALLLANGQMETGELFSFVIYSGYIGGTIGGVAAVVTRMQKFIGATEDLFEIFESEEEKIQPSKIKQSRLQLSGRITFNKLSFAYPSRPETEVLKNINLTIEPSQVVALVGKSGAGKSHLATAIGIEACLNDYKTRFVTGYELVNELVEAQREKDLSRVLRKYSRYHLLILDELGYVPFTKEGAQLLFLVLVERHERGSVLITSNLGFADWTEIFGDATLTTALLDRVTHNAKILNCNWESYRLRQTLKNNKKKKGRTGKK